MTLAALMLTCGSSDSAACARASTMTLPSGVAAGSASPRIGTRCTGPSSTTRLMTSRASLRRRRDFPPDYRKFLSLLSVGTRA